MALTNHNLYVFVTLMTKQSGIKLVGELIARGMTIGPLNSTRKLMSGEDRSASFVLALNVTYASKETEQEKARAELHEKINDVINELKISHYSKSTHVAHQCSWSVGNIEFNAPQDESGDKIKLAPEFTGLP
jgi:hypothetical protein